MGKWHRKRAGRLQARIGSVAAPRGLQIGGGRLQGVQNGHEGRNYGCISEIDICGGDWT